VKPTTLAFVFCHGRSSRPAVPNSGTVQAVLPVAV